MAKMEFECSNLECGYKYAETTDENGTVRLEGFQPPLIYRVMGILESVTPKLSSQLPQLPLLAVICPICGNGLVAFDQPRIKHLIDNVQLAAPSDAGEVVDEEDEEPPMNFRGFSRN